MLTTFQGACLPWLVPPGTLRFGTGGLGSLGRGRGEQSFPLIPCGFGFLEEQAPQRLREPAWQLGNLSKGRNYFYKRSGSSPGNPQAIPTAHPSALLPAPTLPPPPPPFSEQKHDPLGNEKRSCFSPHTIPPTTTPTSLSIFLPPLHPQA